MKLTLPRAVERVAAIGAPERSWFTRIAANAAEAEIGSRDRWIVKLVEATQGVELSARRARERRDERLVQVPHTEEDLDALAPELDDLMTWWTGRLTVYSLVPGHLYRVAVPFSDRCGTAFHAEEELRFLERHFLPHDGGHTIVFARPDGLEQRMYLQEDDERDILDNLDAHLLG